MEKEKRKMSTWSVIKRQLKIIKEHKVSYIYVFAFIYALCAGVLPVIAVYMPKIIIDAFKEDNLNKIYTDIIILTSISLVLAVIIAICKNAPETTFLKIRIKEFARSNRKFINIDYAYMEEPKFLDEIERNMKTLNSNQDGFEGTYHKLFHMLPLILSLGAYLYIIGRFNYLIILAVILGGGVSILVSYLAAKYRYKKKDEESRARRHMRYFYNTCYDFSYGKDIRLYNMENKLENKYKLKIISLITVIKDIHNHNFLYGLLDLLMLLIQDGLAYYFIISSYYGSNPISIGDVSLYLATTIALSTSLRQLGTIIGNIREYTMYTADYLTFYDTPFMTQKGNQTKLDDTLEIEFVDVSFKYPNADKYIFENLNFKINKKEKLAIVGTNGAGKTTLIKLITGLFYPTSGKILINGIDIMEFDQNEYRKMFGVVFQDYHIYAASVIENVIGSDNDEKNMELGKKCLKKVGLKEKIESLPNGYNTSLLKIIDEQGVELSGGQSQKIAIARAIYKDANMVILDEPTAALDALAEAKIYQDFDELVHNKTALYVSHRLSSTKFCDHIAMFSNKGLIEYGSHDELMALKREYYEMFTVQGKYYQESEETVYEKA